MINFKQWLIDVCYRSIFQPTPKFWMIILFAISCNSPLSYADDQQIFNQQIFHQYILHETTAIKVLELMSRHISVCKAVECPRLNLILAP